MDFTVDISTVTFPLITPQLSPAEESVHCPRLHLQLGHRLHLDVEPHLHVNIPRLAWCKGLAKPPCLRQLTRRSQKRGMLLGRWRSFGEFLLGLVEHPPLDGGRHVVQLRLGVVKRTEHLVLESLASVQVGATTPLTLDHSTRSPLSVASVAVSFITVNVVAVGAVLVDVALLKLRILPVLPGHRLACPLDCSVDIILPPLSLDLLVPMEDFGNAMVEPVGVLAIANLHPGEFPLRLVAAVCGRRSTICTAGKREGGVAAGEMVPQGQLGSSGDLVQVSNNRLVP